MHLLDDVTLRPSRLRPTLVRRNARRALIREAVSVCTDANRLDDFLTAQLVLAFTIGGAYVLFGWIQYEFAGQSPFGQILNSVLFS